ncbi:12678_t:CDS:2, partial [Rhizophagus irregularis]
MTQKVPEGTVAQMNDNQKKVNKIITGISLQATLISQQTWKDLQETPYRCDGIDYFFEEVITNRTRQKQNNGNSQDRVVQVFNASLRLTTAIIKPFMRKYGELEEEKCYSRRPHAHAPNRQVVYITFKDANSVHRFYDNHVLWIYGEMLYVTPFLMDKNIREGLKQFCMKLNGLPPNAQAVEFKEFIDHHSVVEFYIPRNTYTNDTQKYAYVYFKDEAAMVAATQEIFLVRNKQTEWSDPSVQSCFRCGYTGHYMRDCDYVPPRTRPMRKNEYFRQIKEIRQNRFARNRAINYSSPATYAQMAAQSNRKFRKRDYNAGNTRNGNQNDRSRDVLRGTQKGGSIHMKDKEKEEWYHRQTNDNLQDIKNDFAKIKDMMDCIGGVVFNSNNKRTRNEESSGSESNAANNVYILSNRMDQADDTMKKMMDMLQNMSTKFEQIYNNQENNANNKQKSTELEDKINQTNVVNNTKAFFNVGTLNIRGMTKLKMMNIKDTLTKYNFDVLAVTETKINIKYGKFLTQEVGINKNYTIFGTIDNTNINSTGLLVFIKNNIANHVTKVQNHMGRILEINLNFSKHNKLSIISIYNKSGNSAEARNLQQTINQLVINMIKDARRNQYQIMLLGDFNLRYAKYEKLKNRGVRINNQLSIFKYLENHDFIDVHKDSLEIDDQQLMERFSTFSNYTTFSRIIISQPSLSTKIKRSYRVKYHYEELNDDDKQMITDTATKELENRLKNYKPNNIEEKWNIYNHVISTTKKSHIKHSEIKISFEREDQDIKNTLEYRFYRYIVYIRRNLKKDKKFAMIKDNWKIIIKNLRSMIKALEINNEFYVLSYNFSKFLKHTYLKEMEELYSIAYIFLNTEMIKKKEQKIMDAIAKRQQDLEYNQRRMIDNVMEREFKKINIDRLIVQDKDGEDILVTNEGEIKKLVANHFQNCAGSVNCEKEIPAEWIDEYRPKEELSESIYDSVLTPITLEEIIEIGKMLPGKKAN